MAIYGYARVSTDGQSYDSQKETLKANGAGLIFSEKESGAKTDRKELAKAIAKLDSGDTLLVTAIDRLARSTRDLLNILEEVSKKGATFKSLSESWADTTHDLGMILIPLLASIAQWERKKIRERCDIGRARAKKNGVKFGRKHKLKPYQRAEAIARREAGESLSSIAKSYDCSHQTIGRL